MDTIAKWTIIILFVFMAGCASVKTTIKLPCGQDVEIWSKKDALVTFKTKDIEGTVDNRGKLGILESIFGVLILKTDVNLSNKEGTQ